jgi:hypothetical protein
MKREAHPPRPSCQRLRLGPAARRLMHRALARPPFVAPLRLDHLDPPVGETAGIVGEKA